MKNLTWRKTIILVLVFVFAFNILLTVTSCNKEEDPLKLTYQTWTESFIIGYISQILIEENTDYTVKRVALDSNALIWQAFVNDDIDIWGGYTSSFFQLFDDGNVISYDSDEVYNYIKDKLKNEYDLIMLERMGFYNNYDLAVTSEIAEQYKLSTYSDLADVSNKLAIAGDVNFRDRDDNYPLLQREYKMDFKEIYQMSVNAKFEAVKNGDADVVSCYSTDAGIARLGLKLLQDDKQIIPIYDAAYVVRAEIMDKYPDLKDVLEQLKITVEEMGQMNYQVEGQGMEAEDVARQFLEDKGLI